MKNIKIQVYDKVNDRWFLFQNPQHDEEYDTFSFSGDRLDVPVGDNLELYSISVDDEVVYRGGLNRR